MPTLRSSDGVVLSWTDDGGGPPVVLLAGFRAQSRTWLFQRRHLLSLGYRVLCLDRRGQGNSQAPTHGARMSRHGADLAEFLDRTGLVHAFIVGASMGASAVWAYVDLLGSSRIRAVVSIDQTPAMRNSAGWPYGYYGYTADNLGTFFADGAPATGRGTARRDMGQRLHRLCEALGVDVAELDGPPPRLPNAALALLQGHALQDWRDVIEQLAVPALFIAGRDSELWPREHAAAAAALNPLAASVVIENCGHNAHMEQPDAVNEAVARFLQTPPRSI